MKNTKQPNYVTMDVFERTSKETKKEFKNIHAKIDKVALSLVKTQTDVGGILHTLNTKVATNDRLDKLINQIDHFSKKIDVYDKRVVFHDYRINDLDERVSTLEKNQRRA